MQRRLSAIATVIVMAAAMTACGNKEVYDSEMFVQVQKTSASQGLKEGPDAFQEALPDESFYLAIHRSVLNNQRWFMSASVSQENGQPGFSMGTRVVRFAAQNGKLVVLNADVLKDFSIAIASEEVLDSFEIVTNFRRFRNERNYIVFDPAAAQNRFVISPFTQSTESSLSRPVEVYASYLQNYRGLDDGISFEKIVGGTVVTDEGVEGVQMTLGLSFRMYEEGINFAEVPAPATDHYFVGHQRPIGTTGYTVPAVKFNIYEGMDPIEFVLSQSVLDIQADPRFADNNIDIVGAVRAGIENWNSVFGYEALTTRIAADSDRWANNDVNYLLVDPSSRLGYAYADIGRFNPNTGEARSANIYFSSVFINGFFDTYFPAAEPATGAKEAAGTQTTANIGGAQDATIVGWGGAMARQRPQCVLQAAKRPSVNGVAAAAMTPAEMVETSITQVILHEMGHVLGLRHNFKGSVSVPTASTMDYTRDADSLLLATPGAYDVDAVRYLYGLSAELPGQPFCTDDDIWAAPSDGNCYPYDEGQTPLTDYWLPTYNDLRGLYLGGVQQVDGILEILSILIHRFEWGERDETESLVAIEGLLDGIGVNVPEGFTLPDDAVYQTQADLAAMIALETLFTASDLFGFIPADLPTIENYPVYTKFVQAQLVGIAENTDGIRSLGTRIKAIGFLKQYQTSEGFTAANGVRENIDIQLAAETAPAARAELKELAIHAAAAVTPYYNY